MVKKIIFAIIGVVLIAQSIFTWVTSLQNKISLFENGPTAVFIIQQISVLSYLINIVFLFLGIVALFKALPYRKGNP